MVLGIVAIVAAFVFLLVFNMTMFSQGEMNQLSRSEHLITCELAARSAYQQQINELRVKPWQKRSFATAPSRLQKTLEEHELDILIENTPGQARSADLWVVATRGKVKRLVFWRVRVMDSVFQKINDVQPVYFAFLDPERFGPDGDRPEVRRMVDEALARRDRKLREKEILTRKVMDKRQFGGVMSELGIPVLGEVMDIQTPFVPGSSVGYADSPLNMLLAGFKPDQLLSQGAMSLSDFSTVQAASAIDPSVLDKLRQRVGEDASIAILQKMSRLDRQAEGDPLLAFGGGATFLPRDSDDVLAVLGPLVGLDDPGMDPTSAATDEASEPGEEGAISSVGPMDGGMNWPVVDPDAIETAGNATLVPPVEDPPVEPGPPPIPPGGSEFSFDDLTSRRDLYDEDFVKRWDNIKLPLVRSLFAYSYQSMSRKVMKMKLDDGTATMADFEKYIRANNSYGKYTKAKHWYNRSEEKRDSIINKARKYFVARPPAPATAGVSLDSEGNPVN